MRVTIPIMISPIVLLFALQLLRMFSRFEQELILGLPIGFYVYSTLIFDMVRLTEPPLYGQATALAGLTLISVAMIVPFQRWIIQRRRYTTITGSFKSGLIVLGPWKWIAFAFVVSDHFLSMFTLFIMVVGSFMSRVGFFEIDPVFTLRHWQFGRWLAASKAMEWASGSLFLVAAGVLLGAGAVGALRAAQTLLGVTHILFQGLENIVPVQAAQRYHEDGLRALLRYLRRSGALLLAATAGVALVLAAAPEFWLDLQNLHDLERAEKTAGRDLKRIPRRAG